MDELKLAFRARDEVVACPEAVILVIPEWVRPRTRDVNGRLSIVMKVNQRRVEFDALEPG